MAMEVIESGCNIDVIYTGRKHKVCVDGELSTWAYTKSGIEVQY